MQAKRLDDRIAHLIDTGIENKHRSMFLLLGINAHKQIPTLFQIYQQKCLHVPKIAWCYSDRPQFKKQAETIDQTLSDGTQNQFKQNQIRFTHYRDAECLLGQTFSILILQDFEYLTPNLLAMTIETVRGGGLVIFLMNNVESLEQLRSSRMSMQKRYETISGLSKTSVSRFIERFLKVLQTSERLLALDEQLNVIEITENTKKIMSLQKLKHSDDSKLKSLQKGSENCNNPVRSALGKVAVTFDQCNGLFKILDLFSGLDEEKTTTNQTEEPEEEPEKEEINEEVNAHISKQEQLEARKMKMLQKRNIKAYNNIMKELQPEKEAEKEEEPVRIFPVNKQLFLKAARGRGKSALLGLAIAAAISQKATNILLFAPRIENIQTVFQFVEVGLKAIGYLQYQDYKVLKTGDKNLDCISGIDVFKTHRQVIRFIQPDILNAGASQTSLISLADLLVIDEAAAMPITLLKQILQSETFSLISSTVHGYEGSGRALQVKVVKQLQDQAKHGKQLTQLELETPIRYESGDDIERWLYNLLLLDCEKFLEQQRANFQMQSPLPADCQLYMVSRDCLFSGEPTTESFLKLIWSIFATSHYKNQPNDIMLLSDNPSHRLFVLLGPITDVRKLQMPLAVIQVALEGLMDTQEVERKLHTNQRDEGNMVPWLLSQQYLSPEFAKKVGARTVRIAANPYCSGQGYGSKALFDLKQFYGCKLQESSSKRVDRDMLGYEAGKMPPLLFKLTQLEPEPVNYLSVAFGLTPKLYQFWNKNLFQMVHLKQNLSQETCEHSCVMVQELKDCGILNEFRVDFQKRFYNLLDISFKELEAQLALRILTQQLEEKRPRQFSAIQMKRIHAYCKRALDYHSVMDLMKEIAEYFFIDGQCCQLNAVQKVVLLGIAVQKKTFAELAKELQNDADQCQAIFAKAIAVLDKAGRADVM
ncbi:N-acetyltransferase-like_protein [Hexamita inflata]|uniref:N-acetyltransferase-like_protein n=1 Tax=Hexamita inflata TaxID=28002 RepID=A0ABP1K208_9EUKA